ncbi:MAG: hypothetical protein H7145_20910 [Akkermansiaceae bacterium]|nr:hypothetical protein [Armatimonadota bacterium]
MLVSAVIIGVTGLRHPVVLPRRGSLVVLLFGLLTLPLGLALWMLERRAPPYWVTELHFVFSGAAWFVVGGALRRGLFSSGGGRA